jgi:hypothetical protein
MDFSVPVFFLGAVGALYTIDNVYPYGQFTPFQLLVPTTAALAAAVLNAMGYPTSLTTAGSMPRLTATDPANPLRTATFDIAWPCAGIESLLIFTVVALLFLKRMPISLKAKIGYFAIGTAVTYHQHSEDSCYLHNWNERRRRANVPLLLRSTILNRMDRSVSPDNPFKPEPMAQNHQQSERQTAPKRSEEIHT